VEYFRTIKKFLKNIIFAIYLMCFLLYNKSLINKGIYIMQGSFGDATERFRGGKKRDTEKAKTHEQDKNWRKKRRDRHVNE
jgi:hypothetical protein